VVLVLLLLLLLGAAAGALSTLLGDHQTGSTMVLSIKVKKGPLQ
jgi:hypothetical protein